MAEHDVVALARCRRDCPVSRPLLALWYPRSYRNALFVGEMYSAAGAVVRNLSRNKQRAPHQQPQHQRVLHCPRECILIFLPSYSPCLISDLGFGSKYSPLTTDAMSAPHALPDLWEIRRDIYLCFLQHSSPIGQTRGQTIMMTYNVT